MASLLTCPTCARRFRFDPMGRGEFFGDPTPFLCPDSPHVDTRRPKSQPIEAYVMTPIGSLVYAGTVVPNITAGNGQPVAFLGPRTLD